MSSHIFFYFFIFIIGTLLLIWSADKFVSGAATIAARTGISHLLIGLTIVAIGTSIPELFISIAAIFDDSAQLALGDAIGSNIANMGLVTGCLILFKPTILHHSTSLSTVIIFIISTVIACLVFLDNFLSIWDGIFLFGLFIIVLYLKIHLHKNNTNTKQNENVSSLSRGVFWIIAGIALLPISAQLTVMGSIGIARYFNISEYIIGVFLVAIGTSLPELATTLISLLKNEKELAIGNIIGSNIFNLTLVLAPISIFTPITLPAGFLSWDLPLLLVLSVIYAAIIATRHARFLRIKGLVLLCTYSLYVVISLLNIF